MSREGQRRLDGLFSRVAPVYDLQLPLERRALAAAARAVGPLAGLRVLDLAAGTGAFSAALVDAQGPPSELVCLDRSPAMLDRARRRLERRAKGARVEVGVGDARRLTWPAARFDLVAIGYLLHLLERPDAQAVLSEARRVLAPGGRLVVVEHAVPPGRGGRAYRRAWELVVRAVPGIVSHGPRSDAAPLLSAAGFAVTHYAWVLGGYWSQVLLAMPQGADG